VRQDALPLSDLRILAFNCKTPLAEVPLFFELLSNGTGFVRFRGVCASNGGFGWSQGLLVVDVGKAVTSDRVSPFHGMLQTSICDEKCTKTVLARA
jgi:hypothetical protein